MNSRAPATLSNAPYHMPPEWAPQERIWFSWPHAKADWPGKFAPIPWVFAEMIRVITMSGQRVGLVVKDDKTRAEAMQMLDRNNVSLSMVDLFEAPTNRGWLRDCGPIWVREALSQQLVAANWRFNGWAKYKNHKHDDALPPLLAEFTGHKSIFPKHKGKEIVLEGGGIDVDGAGNVLVTKEWLLSDIQVRNPGFTQGDYEEIFANFLGAPNTIWLEAGIAGDDTHGHIDDITRFVAPRAVVTCIEDDVNDENYGTLQTNRAILGRTTLSVTELPMPRPVIFEQQRLPASYANFLICNHVVLVPVFNDPADAVALTRLEKCFPDRTVVPIYARDLVWGLGTIHCLSQQQPA